MEQYTRKQLKEYARLGLARDLTGVDPDTLPKWYEKIGVSRGIYGMNGGLIWDKVTGGYGVILVRSSNLFRLFWGGYTMRNIEIGSYIRISKKEAEKRYNAGGIIHLCACRVSPVNVWGVYVDCKKEEFPHIGNDGFNTIAPRNRELETVVNAFRWYSCNYETGYYPAYYVKAVQL